MRRPICWTEKLEGGVKRELRVSFHGSGLRWQWKRSDEENWVYDGTPSSSDWDGLEALAANWYSRHRMPHEHVIRIHRLRQDAEDTGASGKAPP